MVEYGNMAEYNKMRQCGRLWQNIVISCWAQELYLGISSRFKVNP